MQRLKNRGKKRRDNFFSLVQVGGKICAVKQKKQRRGSGGGEKERREKNGEISANPGVSFIQHHSLLDSV